MARTETFQYCCKIYQIRSTRLLLFFFPFFRPHFRPKFSAKYSTVGARSRCALASHPHPILQGELLIDELRDSRRFTTSHERCSSVSLSSAKEQRFYLLERQSLRLRHLLLVSKRKNNGKTNKNKTDKGYK